MVAMLRSRASSMLAFLLCGLLALMPTLAQAAAPTFCKCTCFKNSTLIQLGPESSSSARRADFSDHLAQRSASASCTQCTRAFCLSHNLPICKDAEEGDTVATCFQRDSRKDELIVWGFILGTTGLLAWAAVKRVAEYRENKKSGGAGGADAAGRPTAVGNGEQDRGNYAPLGAETR